MENSLIVFAVRHSITLTILSPFLTIKCSLRLQDYASNRKKRCFLIEKRQSYALSLSLSLTLSLSPLPLSHIHKECESCFRSRVNKPACYAEDKKTVCPYYFIMTYYLWITAETKSSYFCISHHTICISVIKFNSVKMLSIEVVY